ncbi:VCBS repeat-containing protein [Fulvivirgaceae bacterium BMA10]|uniref:VCBS repeat-containing protein n=1 Tax=Splendidivirga corallicola TaxID=3051826 RepID=A0ABT8KPH0_9BACT|nr:VCBS repeat-containing protein [Fulvivirgaceae bacterium BMA10]
MHNILVIYFKNTKIILYGFVVISILAGCNNGTNDDTQIESLFQLLSANQTSVDFRNELPESAYMNRFVYEYFYNGGGVAIGDVNNDGLDDIYFTANLKDNKLYLNKGGLKFEDITDKANVAGKKGWATGVTMIDINADGQLDIYVGRAGRFTDEDKRRNELFINQGTDEKGNPVFIESAADYGLDDPAFTTQASFFDYDRDGDLDMFLANHNIEAPPVEIKLVNTLRETNSPLGGNKLFRNDQGMFEEVTSESGIESHGMNYTLGISIGDVNDDGWPDIYIANDYSEPDRLYINNQDGTFKDIAGQSFGQMPNFSMGSDMADINNDGFKDIIALDMMAEDNYGIKTSMSGMNPELFWEHVESGLHHQYMYNALQLNGGNDEEQLPIFSEIGQLAGISNTDWSWAPLLADFNNDGLKDIFVTNGIKRDFRNNDFNIFLRKATEDVIEKKENPLKYYAYWTRLSPTREKMNYLFRNSGEMRFTNMAEVWGLEQSSFSNGAAYGDLDNDGDLDLVVNNIDSLAFVYENLSNRSKDHHFLTVKLSGPEENKFGIGTQITLINDGISRTVDQYPSRGFQSSVSPILHFGLGDITTVEKLIITWPDGKKQELENIKSDQQLFLTYKNAQSSFRQEEKSFFALFKDVTREIQLECLHNENLFDDFERESLLPHKMSQMGPALSVGDVNNDDLEDFYMGGARGYPGQLFIQRENGTFERIQKQIFQKDKAHEDVASVLFDADGDGDKDLYVVSGGNELEPENSYYVDRFYENRSGQFIRIAGAIPAIPFSGGCVIASDFDNDGDQDLFVGGRQIPGKYPYPESSYIFRNDSQKGEIRFTDVSSEIAPMLENIGMVSDALWVDIDHDDLKDLMIVGEWMTLKVLKNTNGIYKDITETSGLSDETGWWNCIVMADFDQDGDQDFVAGNLGLNYKYKASKQAPFEIYTTDFDNSGTQDIVLGYHDDGAIYPVRGRECSSQQMPFIKEKFPNYNTFGSATISEVYGRENLDRSLRHKATNFATSYIENLGNGTFDIRPLENLAQFTSINSIEVADFNGDGHMDILLAGNMHGAEVETPRNDAGYGVCLLGNGKGHFKGVMPYESGLLIKGETRNSGIIKLNHFGSAILFAKNDDYVQIVDFNIQHEPTNY